MCAPYISRSDHVTWRREGAMQDKEQGEFSADSRGNMRNYKEDNMQQLNWSIKMNCNN